MASPADILVLSVIRRPFNYIYLCVLQDFNDWRLVAIILSFGSQPTSLSLYYSYLFFIASYATRFIGSVMPRQGAGDASSERHPHDGTASEVSPLTRPAQIERLIPQGRVASLVSHIQNDEILNSSGTLDAPPPHGREHDYIGYGRRKSSRFAKPASRTSYPSGHYQGTNSHSFLGLNTPQARPDEVQAGADSSPKWYRSPGLYGQIQPDGYQSRVQYEAISPWNVVPTSRTGGTVSMEVKQGDLDRIKQNMSDSRTERSKMPAVRPQPQPRQLSPGQVLGSRDNSPKRQKGRVIDSEVPWSIFDRVSGETTSTMRRQSVRDLFRDYGIERPRGLASSECLAFISEDGLRNQRYRYCHLCRWVNGPGTECERCDTSSVSIAESLFLDSMQ